MTPVKIYAPSMVVGVVSTTSPVSALISSILTPPIPGSPVTRAAFPSMSLNTVPEIVPRAMSPKLSVADPPEGTVTETVFGVVLVNPSGSVSRRIYVLGMTPANAKEPSTVVVVVSTTSPFESSSSVTPPIPVSSLPSASSPSRSSNTRPDMVPLTISPKLAVAEPPAGTITDTVFSVVLVKPSGSVS